MVFYKLFHLNKDVTYALVCVYSIYIVHIIKITTIHYIMQISLMHFKLLGFRHYFRFRAQQGMHYVYTLIKNSSLQ